MTCILFSQLTLHLLLAVLQHIRTNYTALIMVCVGKSIIAGNWDYALLLTLQDLI